jgi:hypothetical protein
MAANCVTLSISHLLQNPQADDSAETDSLPRASPLERDTFRHDQVVKKNSSEHCIGQCYIHALAGPRLQLRDSCVTQSPLGNVGNSNCSAVQAQAQAL